MSARVFHCPWLLTPAGWRSNTWLELDQDGWITAVGEGTPSPGAIRLDGPVLPGMANVHSHAHQRLIAGLTGRRGVGEDSFWSWREQMYRAVGGLSVADLQALATWLYMELLEGGYTCIGEFHYPHRLQGEPPAASNEALLAAAATAGCGLTLLPVWYRYAGFGRQAPASHQKSFVLEPDEFLQLVSQLLDRVSGSNLLRVGMAPHSLRAIDVADLQSMTQAISKVPVHIHIAEQPAEVAECRAATGRRPIELLADKVDLDGRWCLIHATHASDSEIALMARAGVVAGLCPTTEADLGDGIFPARALLDSGGCLAIGSDSNLETAAASELRLLEWSQRLVTHQRNVLVDEGGGHIGRFLWTHAAIHGARALDQPSGEVAVGRRADLVVLNATHPLLAGLDPDAQLDTFLMARPAGMIDRVIVAGQEQVRAGRHIERARFAAAFIQLRRRLQEHWQ